MTRGNDFSNRPDLNRPNPDENPAPIADETIHTRPATSDEIAYRNGYAEAQQEERVRENLRRTRENNSAATGIVVGVILASIVGLTLAAIALLAQNRQSNPPTTSPSLAPSPTQPQPTPSPQTSQPQNTQTTERTTIIERAPQQTEIIVPPAPAPATQPTQPSVTQPPTTQPDLTQPQTESDATTQPTQPAAPDSTTVPPTGSDPNVGQ